MEQSSTTPPPLHLFLVRHGDREDYDVRRGALWKACTEQIPQQRRKDPPLSTLGHEQARDVAQALHGLQTKYNLHTTQIYSSPYLRCIQTATPTADLFDTAIHLENGLAECHYANNYIASAAERFAYFPRVAVPSSSMYEPVANDDSNPPFKPRFNIAQCESFPLGYMQRMIAFAQVLTATLQQQDTVDMTICFSHAASVALVAALTNSTTLPWTMAPTGIFHLVLHNPNDNSTWSLLEQDTAGTNGHCTHTSPGTFAWGFDRVEGAKDLWGRLTSPTTTSSAATTKTSATTPASTTTTTATTTATATTKTTTQDDGWQVASGRKSRRPKMGKKTPTTQLKTLTTSNIDTLVADVHSLSNLIAQAPLYLQLSTTVRQWLATFSNPGNGAADGNTPPQIVEIVAYGLGQPTRPTPSMAARTQLACLVRLMTDFAPLHGTVAYDPCSNRNDLALYTRLNITPLHVNEECRRTANKGPTLFFMPHCAHRMYSNVLWSNWNAVHLQNVVIVGNSFSKYGLALKQHDPSDCVALLSKYISEIQLHDSLVTTTNTTLATMLPTPAMAQQLLAAFTDTSVMHVLGKGIEQLKQDHVLETVPPKTPATTTLWEKELVKSTEVGGQ